MTTAQTVISIGDYTLDTAREGLFDSAGNAMPLRAKAWLALRFLAAHAGQVVSKQALLDEIWGGRAVTEDALVQAIGDIRQALGASGRTALRTLPRRGYMLIAADCTAVGGAPPATVSIGDQMLMNASKRFVGRSTELKLLRKSIAPTSSDARIYYVHGPGGIGKTTLLEYLRWEAKASDTIVNKIDLSGVSPTANSFLATLAALFGHSDFAGTVEDVAARLPIGRRLLMLDSFEALEPIKSWFRDTFLPALPSNVSVVLASRLPPDSYWTAHPLWAPVLVCIGLGSLSSRESIQLLDKRGVSNEAHKTVVELCHGHPLTLVLLADEFMRTGVVPGELGADHVRTLIKRCVMQVPTPLYRSALEASACSRTTTVALLSDVVDPTAAAELFEWLSEQSYMRSNSYELSPHDLVRDVIDEDLHGRDPQASAALQDAINKHWLRQLQMRRDTSRVISELMFLERRSGPIHRFFDFGGMSGISVGPATKADQSDVIRIRDARLPAPECRLFDHWLNHAATEMFVARSNNDEIRGVTLVLRLDRIDGQSVGIDPIVDAVLAVLGDALRDPSEPTISMMSRFTLPEGENRIRDPAMNALQKHHAMIWATEAALKFFVIVDSHPDELAPLLEGTGFQRMAGCDRTIGGLPSGCFVHDWKEEPWAEWRQRCLESYSGR